MPTPIDRISKMSDEAERIYHETEGDRRYFDTRYNISVMAIKCMDGRADFTEATGAPFAWVYPVRTIGGMIDIGWPAFKPHFERRVRIAGERKKSLLMPVTYHFSALGKDFSCKGYDYDTAKAVVGQTAVRDQFDRVTRTLFIEGGVRQVYTVLVGINTDDRSIILHGNKGETLETNILVQHSEIESEALLRERLPKLYPEMPTGMIQFLTDRMVYNRTLVMRKRTEKVSSEDLDHNEWILAVGNRFDYIRTWNSAIKIKSWDPNFIKTCMSGAHIIFENIEEGRVSKKDGVVLLVNESFDRDTQHYDDWRAAEESARWMYREVSEAIISEFPTLREYMHPLVGIVSTERRLHRLDIDEKIWGKP